MRDFAVVSHGQPEQGITIEMNQLKQKEEDTTTMEGLIRIHMHIGYTQEQEDILRLIEIMAPAKIKKGNILRFRIK